MGSPIKYYRVPEVSRTCCVNVVDSMIKEEGLLRYSSFLLLEFFKNSISSSNKTRKNDGNCFN